MDERKLKKTLNKLKRLEGKLTTQNLFEGNDEEEDVELKMFFGAVQAGNNRAVHAMFLKDIDPNAVDEHGRSGLHMAALGGHQDVFSTLLNKGANPEQSDKAGITPLMCACQKGNGIIVDLLLDKRVDVTKKTKDGLSAVFYALFNRHMDIAEKLEKQKSCIHELLEDPIVSIYTKAVSKNWIEIVKFMHNNQCDMSYSHKLKIASQVALCGQTDMLQYFKVKFDEKLKDGRSPLRCAVQNGFIDAVRYMLDNGCDVSNNEECVKTAIISNHLDVLKLLMEHGAPMFKPDEDEITPVQLAIVQGSFEMFKYLVDLGCSLEPHKDLGSLALIAASRRKPDVLKYLAENKRFLLNEADPTTGETPLLAASQKGPFEAVELLLDHGCNPNAKNRRGVTPALRAAHNKQDEILMLLGERKADLDVPNRIGETAILCAARNKSLPMVQYLADNGCSLDTQDVNGRTVAYYAVQTNNVAILRFLQRRNVYIDEPDINGVTPLMTAIKTGAMDAIKQLISTPNLCSINHRDWNGRTSMHIAVSSGKTEIMKMLHEKKADLNTSDHSGNTPLLETLKNKKTYETLLYLINNNCELQATNDDLKSAMHYACMHEENDALMLLLDAQCPFDTQDRYGMTPFMISATKKGEFFTTILKAVGADVNTRNTKGENAVHLAAKYENLKIVQSFSLFGCNMDQEDSIGITPLMIACFKNIPLMVEFLIRKKADVNAVTHKGETPAHFTCYSGSLDVLKQLHSKNALLDQPDLNGVTPILIASAKQNEEFVTFLYNNGCDVNRADKSLKTALHHAVAGRNESVVRFLLEKGLDPNELDESGTSPVLLSTKLGLNSILSILRNKGGILKDIYDNESYSAAHFACRVGNIKLLEELRGQMSFSSRTYDGENCLTITCSSGDEKILKFILEQKQNVNFKNSSGDNALHIAAKKSHLHLISLLIQNRIRVTDKNADGDTALHILSGKICSSRIDKAQSLRRQIDDDDDMQQLKEALNKRQAPDELKSGLVKMMEKAKTIPDKLIKKMLPSDCISKKGLIEQLTKLLDAGVDVNEVNNSGKMALHFACIHGSKAVIDLLLSRGAEVNLEDLDGETPIFTAVREGKEKTVDLLIKKNADLAVRNKNGLSPLGLAVAMNNAPIKEILLEKDAQFDTAAVFRSLAIDKVFKQHNLTHLDFLISRGFDGKKVDNGKTLLHYIVLNGDVRLLKSLTDGEKYAFVREIIDFQDNNGETALHLAVMRGRLDMAKILIDSGCRVDIKSHKGHTVLHVAAIENKLSITKWTMENSKQKIFDPLTTEQEETPSPLHLAAIKGNLEVFKYLEQNGFSAASKCKNGNNCAHYAAIYGNLHVLEYLQTSEASSELFKKLVTATNNSDFTPLEGAVLNGHENVANFFYNECGSELPDSIVHLALQSGNQHMVDWVQKRGANMKAFARGDDKDTVLFTAVLSGNFHLVKRFFSHANTSETNAHDCTLVQTAAVRNHRHLIKFLKDQGAPLNSPDIDGDTPITDCAVYGQLESMKMLQELGCSLTHRNAKKRDIVHLACIGFNKVGHLNIVEYACHQQLPLDEADQQENSGLMYACRQGFKDIAEFLLNKKCNPNKANENGTTAAHLAVMADRSDILDLIWQHGARLDSGDNDGTTPLMIAVYRSSPKCAALLIEKVGLREVRKCNKHGWSLLRLAAFTSDDVRHVMMKNEVHPLPDDGERPSEKQIGMDIDMELRAPTRQQKQQATTATSQCSVIQNSIQVPENQSLSHRSVTDLMRLEIAESVADASSTYETHPTEEEQEEVEAGSIGEREDQGQAVGRPETPEEVSRVCQQQ